MNPRAKKFALLGGALTVVCALAAPKLLPLWRARAATAVAEGKAGASEKRGSGGSSNATIVGTQKVKPAALAETIELVGTLRADEAVELQAETTGKVTEISFTEGARVKRGELLVRLNDAELRASLERAEARRELARLKERRLAALLKNGSVNQQDYDGAASEFAVADADAHVIQAQLEKTVIRAPFDGVVGLRNVSVGTYLATTARVATLQAVDRMKLDFAVPERHAARLRPGAKLRFTVTGGAAAHVAEVYAVEPRVDEATRTVLVRASVENPDGRLAPGALAQISVTLQQWDAAMLVPAMAVLTSDKGKSLYVVEGGVAKTRAVETGLRQRELVQVTSGVQLGDVVIVAGVQAVKNGARVKTESE